MKTESIIDVHIMLFLALIDDGVVRFGIILSISIFFTTSNEIIIRKFSDLMQMSAFENHSGIKSSEYNIK